MVGDGERFVGAPKRCVDHGERRRPWQLSRAESDRALAGGGRLLEAVQAEQNAAPRAPRVRVARRERHGSACQLQSLYVTVELRRIDCAVGDQISRLGRYLERADAVRARLVEAPELIERAGPVLMDERELRGRCRSLAEALDRRQRLALLHQADPLHVQGPRPVGSRRVLEHVVQCRQRARELRRPLPGLLGEIVVCEHPGIDLAQNFLGALREQVRKLVAATNPHDIGAVRISTAQRELIFLSFTRDLPADLRLGDAQQPMDLTRDGLQRNALRHQQIDLGWLRVRAAQVLFAAVPRAAGRARHRASARRQPPAHSRAWRGPAAR